MTRTTGSFVGTLKNHKDLIRNLVFVISLIVLGFQFKLAFTELVDLVDNNQVYIQVGSFGGIEVPGKKPLVPDKVFLGTERFLDKGQSESYVKTSTLRIYTYKLFQTILLLFGIFMCIIFMSINNRNFSWIEYLEKKE